MAVEQNPVNGDVTVSWPSRIVIRQCPTHGLVEDEFLERMADMGEEDVCVVPTYQEEPCGEPLTEDRVEYLHPLHEEMWRDALRGVSNAYGCFAGCTGALPGAPADESGHTPACTAARRLLSDDSKRGAE